MANVCQTTIVEDAWARGQELTVHGVVYGLEDGLLRDLGVSRRKERRDGALSESSSSALARGTASGTSSSSRGAPTRRGSTSRSSRSSRAGTAPRRTVHASEDDAFYLLEGELVFTADGEEIVAGPGTFVLVPPGVEHTFENRSDAVARFVNVHAPAGFDLRLEAD